MIIMIIIKLKLWDPPELIRLWMFSLLSASLSQLCVDMLKSCRTDNCRTSQIHVLKMCFPSLRLAVVYSPGLGPAGLWENCWAESRNMTSGQETDERVNWSEKSKRSKPAWRRRISSFPFLNSVYTSRWNCNINVTSHGKYQELLVRVRYDELRVSF